MKKLAEVVEVSGEGLEALLGLNVILFCSNYFWTGKLAGVNHDFVKLENPAIVYETGPFYDKGWKDEHRLHTNIAYVMVGHIEAFVLSK